MWNRVKSEDVFEEISNLKLTDFQKTVKKTKNSKMSFVLESSDVKSVMNYENVKKRFKWLFNEINIGIFKFLM